MSSCPVARDLELPPPPAGVTRELSRIATSEPQPRQAGQGGKLHREETSLLDFNTLSVIHRNTLPPRSHFFLYNSEKDALEASQTHDVTKSKSLLLSGTWRFLHTDGPFQGPVADFFKEDFDTSSWPDIEVPGMWQLQGFGKGPQYTNVPYPFPCTPPDVPLDENECGRYVRTFTVGPEADDHQIRLRFEGVDSAFHVWVNGHAVGYSQGSRNPSEFDITDLVRTSGDTNTLAVQVYQRCNGSYIEDQDQWWLSGIFRDVYLHYFPKAHIKDYNIRTERARGHSPAKIHVHHELSAPSSRLSITVFDPEGTRLARAEVAAASDTPTAITIPEPSLEWTAETPNLYSLVLHIIDSDAYLCQRFGFREVRIADGVFTINGRPVKLRGVNRHEHHPARGRAVPLSFLQRDLALMKTHNVNALRTSHQPNDPRLYDLADELGLYVLDEADLECHGCELAVEEGGDPAALLSDDPAWEASYLDRAEQLVRRDANHASVVIWSLGNESFYGRNHAAMYQWIWQQQQHEHGTIDARPVHYEQDRAAATADMFSGMYIPVDRVVALAREEGWTKPYVLCEYAHAMGNGPGAIKEYVEAFYKYPRLMGGFVWEWANHGLRTTTKDGVEYMGYGGDFGDEPNDGCFVMDGLLDSSHKPTPGLLEYKKAIEPVQTLSIQGRGVRIINRYDFLTLDHLECKYAIIADSGIVEDGTVGIPAGIKPHTEAVLDLQPNTTLPPHRELYLNLYFSLREAAKWAAAGHIVATGQLRLAAPKSIASLLGRHTHPHLYRQPALPNTDTARLTVTQPSPTILHITAYPESRRTGSPAATSTCWTFDLAHGHLTSWRKRGGHSFSSSQQQQDILRAPLTFSLYRALTNNDAGGDDPTGRPGSQGRQWRDARVHLARHHPKMPPVGSGGDNDSVRAGWMHERAPDGGGGTDVVTLRVPGRIAPPVLGWGIDVVTTYRFFIDRDRNDDAATADGAEERPTVLIHVRATAAGPWVPPTLPRFGLALGLPGGGNGGAARVRWFGRGPGESYRDKKEAQLVGLHALPLGALFTDYEVPQENGNRTDVRWVEFWEGGGDDEDKGAGNVGDHGGVRGWRGGKERLLRARFGDLEGASFSASRFTTRELDVARHPFELGVMAGNRVDSDDGGGEETVWVHLDWVHHGLGTGSCGPETMPQYSLIQKEFEFEILLD